MRSAPQFPAAPKPPDPPNMPRRRYPVANTKMSWSDSLDRDRPSYMLPSPEFYERGRGESIDGVAKKPKYASTDFDGRPGRRQECPCGIEASSPCKTCKLTPNAFGTR